MNNICKNTTCPSLNNCPYKNDEIFYCPQSTDALNVTVNKYKKMWERFWYEFDTVYNLMQSKKRNDFREQLLYRKKIIEEELKNE